MAHKQNSAHNKKASSKPESKTNRNDIPHDAMHASANGYDFGAAFTSINDNFTGLNTMTRTGTMVPEPLRGGEPVVMDFVAYYKFSKPRLQSKGA